MNYTTYEQGKELFKKGLPKNTADMAYIRTPDNSLRIMAYSYTETVVMRDASGSNDYVYPCWSLDRLMNIVPHEKRSGIIINSLNSFGHPWTASLYSDKDEFKGSPLAIADSPLEAVYEIVTWLLDNNKLLIEK